MEVAKMNLTRRQFIASLGGTGLFYAFRFTPASRTQPERFEAMPLDLEDPGCKVSEIEVDYTDWIAFGPGDKVSVFTGRAELGQGLKTVITAIVSQGLEILQQNLIVVMGDTDLCPDDGITSGSSSTRMVGWGFWLACEKIRSDVITRASGYLSIPVAELEYRKGGAGRKGETSRLASASELGGGETFVIDIDPHATTSARKYSDQKILNVNAQAIVTGSLKYVGDLKKPGMLYAGWLCPPYHKTVTKLKSVDADEALALPGVKKVEVITGRVAVFGERYTDVCKGIDSVKTTWSEPTRSKDLPLEEARANAVLLNTEEQKGDINAGLAASDLILSESYTTQYIIHCQLETDMAVAQFANGSDNVTVWASTQHSHKARELVADMLKIPMANVRIIGMPAGGAFGGKQANPVNKEAAKLAELAGAPVKLIYSRKDQFQIRAFSKAACIIEVTSGVSSDGKIIARKVDSYQDAGHGTKHTYDIPHVLVNAYRDPNWPVGLASTRGTSYVQTCFATESHIDMLAHKLGIDPFEMRRKNVEFPAYVNLLDSCAEMIGYGNNELEQDEGIGVAIVLHGGAQLGAIAAKVAVNRNSGKITVKHLCGAFDIGTVINRNTVTVGLRGGMAWGIGHALQEENILDGHSTKTEYLSQYKIAKFSDMPPIDISFHDNFQPGGPPRGCGEMPVIPTIGSIANAVYHAIGVRFYSIPITPEKVKKALR
jgi:CO/xanthine dehydrogenase Mo-binding subunit